MLDLVLHNKMRTREKKKLIETAHVDSPKLVGEEENKKKEKRNTENERKREKRE